MRWFVPTLVFVVLFAGGVRATERNPLPPWGDIEPDPQALCIAMPRAWIRDVDFLAYFPTDAQAIEAAAHLDPNVFDVTVQWSEVVPQWLLRAVYRELPTREAFVLDNAALKRLFNEQGGRYEGSGCRSFSYRVDPDTGASYPIAQRD